MREFGAAVAVGVLVVTSGCGGGGGSRPSQDDLSRALRSGGQSSILGPDADKVSKQGADCLAKVLVGSKISDRALQAIVDGDRNYRASRADIAAATALKAKIVACLPAGIS